MKPLLLGGVLLLAVAGTAGAVYVASPGGAKQAVTEVETATSVDDGEVGAEDVPTCDPRATPPPGKQLWRWMDLTVLLPEEGFGAHPEEIPPELKRPNGGRGLNTYTFDPADPSNPKVGSSLLIDAETGAIVHRRGGPEHGKATAIALCPFDPATAPWPYIGDPPDPPPSSTIEWLATQPDPATGMYASFSIGSGGYSGTPRPWVECERVFEGISVSNGRSHAFVGLDPVSGAVCKDLSNVQPEDRAAFERFLDRAALCDLQNVEC